MVEMQLAGIYGSLNSAAVDSLCDEYGALSEMRITVIDSDGSVVGDSEEDPSKMENHADRPEVIQALAGVVGVSERYSGTLNENFIYVAIPMEINGDVRVAVRASIPLTEVDDYLSAMYKRLFVAGIVAALIAALTSLFVSRRISNPIEEMIKGIEHFAADDLDYRIPVQGLAEISELAGTINNMASRLKDRIETVEHQKSEQEAVFSAIPQGLLVVSDDEKIVRMNPGASDLLGISEEEARGKTIQEVVRNQQLQKFVMETLSTEDPVETDFVLRTDILDLHIQARGVKLKSSDGNGSGAVIALNNVSRIRKLENVRREFVANVSHELRTPITAVKGFVETLMDGGVEDKDDANKFLEIINRQADRMSRIITDLLLLAQMESDQETGGIRFEKAMVMDIFEGARQVCSSSASAKNVTIEIDCDDDLEVKGSPDLLEQAIINLAENAIKYSDENEKITIKAYRKDDWLAMDVIDRGCGIEPENQPRLFERFYRTDMARSRKLGGTGLGLAIVKHIVKVHGGRVGVESEFGKGSVFKVRIPIDH